MWPSGTCDWMLVEVGVRKEKNILNRYQRKKLNWVEVQNDSPGSLTQVT